MSIPKIERPRTTGSPLSLQAIVVTLLLAGMGMAVLPLVALSLDSLAVPARARAALTWFLEPAAVSLAMAPVLIWIGCCLSWRDAAALREALANERRDNQISEAIIASLASAISARDRYAGTRVNRVRHYAEALARAAGVERDVFEAVSTGAVVHDIGALAIPDHILVKPGRLSLEEFRRVQDHVRIGAEILGEIPFPFPLVETVLSHHERWDGTGYPRGLRGEEIPIGGRILALVDAFDALTCHRPYRPALSHEEALLRLEQEAGRQFDPHLVQLFQRIYPATIRQIRRLEDASGGHTAAGKGEAGSRALVSISRAGLEMATGYDLAHLAAGQESLAELAARAARRAASVVPGETAAVFLMDECGQVATCVAAHGPGASAVAGTQCRSGEGVTGRCLRDGRTRVRCRVPGSGSTGGSGVAAQEVTTLALQSEDGVLGILCVYTARRGALGEQHLELLQTLAESVSVALQSLRRREAERELAFTDPMTGLPNSRALRRELERMVAERPGPDRAFDVVMLDLDGFKEINDAFGHLRGDETLRHVADLLRSQMRPGDLAFRYGGDEFVLLLPGTRGEDGRAVAERIRQAVSSQCLSGGLIRPSASIGIAECPGDADDANTLLEIADRRMYADKALQKELGSAGPGPGRVRAAV